MELTNKKETEKLMDKFELMWIKTQKFTGEQMRTIVATANDMLKKRMKPYPDFSNYVIALMAFSESGRNLDMFLNWHNIVWTKLFLAVRNDTVIILKMSLDFLLQIRCMSQVLLNG
jgi:hypothetical protein